MPLPTGSVYLSRYIMNIYLFEGWFRPYDLHSHSHLRNGCYSLSNVFSRARECGYYGTLPSICIYISAKLLQNLVLTLQLIYLDYKLLFRLCGRSSSWSNLLVSSCSLFIHSSIPMKLSTLSRLWLSGSDWAPPVSWFFIPWWNSDGHICTKFDFLSPIKVDSRQQILI